jgi:hypothetical protein
VVGGDHAVIGVGEAASGAIVELCAVYLRRPAGRIALDCTGGYGLRGSELGADPKFGYVSARFTVRIEDWTTTVP